MAGPMSGVKVIDLGALESEDVPCATALHLAELPEHPQMQANQSFATLEHPQAGAIIEPNTPANIEGTPSPELRICASLGQHTNEILRDLGRNDTEIEQLREAGVIAWCTSSRPVLFIQCIPPFNQITELSGKLGIFHGFYLGFSQPIIWAAKR